MQGEVSSSSNQLSSVNPLSSSQPIFPSNSLPIFHPLSSSNPLPSSNPLSASTPILISPLSSSSSSILLSSTSSDSTPLTLSSIPLSPLHDDFSPNLLSSPIHSPSLNSAPSSDSSLPSILTPMPETQPHQQQHQNPERSERERVVFEILETERAYVTSLYLAKTLYLLPLRSGVVPSISADDLLTVFSNLEQIHQLNLYFLELLESRVAQWGPLQTIGDIFLKSAPLFHLYGEYLRNYANATQFLGRRAVSAEFVTFLENVRRENKEQLRLLGLHDLLIKPVQRIPRYALLLRTLLQCTPSEHPDAALLQRAMAAIQAVLNQANESIRLGAEYQKVLDVIRRFRKNKKKMPCLFQTGRFLVFQGKVNKITSHGVQYKVRFFLFNDLLVYGEKLASAPHYLRYKGAIPLGPAWLRDLDDTHSVQNLFQVVGPVKTSTLFTNTPEEKQEWMAQINQQINALVAQDPSLTSQRNVLHVNLPSTLFTKWDSRLNILKANAGELALDIGSEALPHPDDITSSPLPLQLHQQQPPPEPPQDCRTRVSSWRRAVVQCFTQPWGPTQLLWLSHALGQWSDRLWGFAIPLVLATYFPSTLFISTLYSFIASLFAFLLGPLIGRWIDGNDRLHVVRSSLIVQNSFVVISSVFLGLIARYASPDAVPTNLLFIAEFFMLIVFGVCSELCSLANSIAITKDWTIHVSKHDNTSIDYLNAIMKRIDLTCGIVAPLIFALILDYSSVLFGIFFVGLWNVISFFPEYFLQVAIYNRVPTLHVPSQLPPKENPLQVLVRGWRSYTTHIVFCPSFAYVLLFITVLSGGVQVSSYLVTQGISTTSIAIFRGAVSVTGVLSTFVVVPISRAMGNVRSGLIFLSIQLACLTVAVGFFFYAEYRASDLALYLFLAGIVLSRVGLWGYDLIEVQLLQILVEEENRGIINGTESSLSQLAWLLILGLGLILHHPAQFGWLVMVSLNATAVASIVYIYWWVLRMNRKNQLDSI